MTVPYPIINNTPPWTQAIAGASQTIFGTNWTANEASDVLVYNRLPSVPANDALQIVDPSLYNVDFIGDDDLVQVTFITAPLQYNIVTIMRNTPADRLNLYTNTNFTSSMLNADIGTLTLVDQQNEFFWGQNIPRYNNSETVRGQDPITGFGYDLVLPLLGANQFWVKEQYNRFFIPVTLPSVGELPVAGPFITYGPSAALIGAFNLGLLADGVLAQTVSGGLSTPYTIPTNGTGNVLLDTGCSIYNPTIYDLNLHEVLGFGETASAVNYLKITNNATGLAPFIGAFGADTNILFQLNGKGNLGVGIQGSAAGTNAIAGNVGEFISSIVPFGSPLSLTSGDALTITSISLTAGDWDVWGTIAFVTPSSTSITDLRGTLSDTDNTLGGAGDGVNITYPGFVDVIAAAVPGVGTNTRPIAVGRILLSATTTIYLVARATFTVSTLTTYGFISARRVR